MVDGFHEVLLGSKGGEFFAIRAVPDAEETVFATTNDHARAGRAGGGLHELRQLIHDPDLDPVVIDDADEIVRGV